MTDQQQQQQQQQQPPRCVLDSQGYITLQCILDSFNTPINEEQAWAVCYQLARHLKAEWKRAGPDCRALSGADSIRLHRDGSVDVAPASEPAGSEHRLVESIGIAIFSALDYGLDGGEERSLSAPLEHLIAAMTMRGEAIANNNNNGGALQRAWQDDEGIEHDAASDGDDDAPAGSFDDVARICNARLAGADDDGAAHYKAVCRALVAESVELSTFLQRVRRNGASAALHEISNESELDEGCLDEICIADWAVLWMQVRGRAHECAGVNVRA
ncbi:PREDICTED: protein spire homolog 1-like [Priapulus caudatus]|uniref:Protein spire homolog 1-like n=1 Tax=Priapulus caudatus TaxID=37621 RepID=A0ABM1EFZ5_PRICU|nr:PREDICTED: protein spire homolog 1-like [Priapulus caudatus]